MTPTICMQHGRPVKKPQILSKIKFLNIMIKTKKYHTVGTIPKSNRKTAEKQNRCRNTHIHDVTHIYMTAHFPGSVHGLQ